MRVSIAIALLALVSWLACAAPRRIDRVSPPVSGAVRHEGERLSSGRIRLVVRSVDNADLGEVIEQDLGPDGRFSFDAVELAVAGREYSQRYFLLLYWIRDDEAVTLWRADYLRDGLGAPIALGCALERPEREGPPCRLVSDPADQPWLLEAGAKDFQRFCASCHGSAGEGGSSVVPGQTRPAPDLVHLAARHGESFPADEIAAWIDGREGRAAHGPSQMPVWGVRLSEETRLGGFTDARIRNRIDILVEYIETIQRPGE